MSLRYQVNHVVVDGRGLLESAYPAAPAHAMNAHADASAPSAVRWLPSPPGLSGSTAERLL
jgi:hypothetical protein